MATASRWWWWIAGVPVGVGFWLLTVVWLLIATHGTGVGGQPLPAAVELATLALGLPLLIIGVLFPIATYYDAKALDTAIQIEFQPSWLGVAAGVSLLSGPVLSVPLACWYLWRRHMAVGIP